VERCDSDDTVNNKEEEAEGVFLSFLYLTTQRSQIMKNQKRECVLYNDFPHITEEGKSKINKLNK
jgi:hypothetical protein